jgi:dTDP-D-glucose 4,6-dehydratase
MEGRSEYRLYGDGQNFIDAMYVTDAVDAIHRMLAGTHWNIVNLAGGRAGDHRNAGT